MIWTAVEFTDRQIAEGGSYRLQRQFTELFSGADRPDDMAMFSTAFVGASPAKIYFSPGVGDRYPAFIAAVGAQPCERPNVSVALLVGVIGARNMLAP
jgi:hypothetical protein